ncbi:hypothetical protein P0F65_21405 [Sphingomonas sp. I4]
MNPILTGLLAASAGAVALTKGHRRLTLSRAKHPGLGGHVRMAKRIAGQIPFYAYSEDRFFRVDDAPDAVAAQRRAGFERLGGLFAERYAKTLALTRETRPGLSDLQFTGAYRVPFQFREKVRTTLATGAFTSAPRGRSWSTWTATT